MQQNDAPVAATAQVAGHPLHPTIVPLPIGSFVGAFVADLAFAASRDRFWARAARLLTGAGVGTGLAAGALGAADFLGRERVRDKAIAWVHGGGNLAAVAIGAASLALRRGDPARAVMPAGLAASSLIVAILGLTGWLGGELVFRHRIGVARR
jgi:uncharacterized membrane protein